MIGGLGTIKNSLMVLMILAFVAVSFFGLYGFLQTEGHFQDPCLNSEQGPPCGTTIPEHITQWQASFTSTPRGSLLLLLAIVSIVLAILVTKFSRLPRSSPVNFIRGYLERHRPLEFAGEQLPLTL